MTMSDKCVFIRLRLTMYISRKNDWPLKEVCELVIGIRAVQLEWPNI